MTRPERKSPGRRKTDKFTSSLKQLTTWALAAVAALLIVWNAAVGVGVQGAEGWHKLQQAFSEPVVKGK